MVDSDTLLIAGAAGFGYLALREITGPSEQAERFQEARDQVISDMNQELEEDLEPIQYDQHIIEYRSKYANRREYLGSEYEDDFPTVEHLEGEFSDRSKENKAYLWKSWFLAINDVALSEELGTGFWDDVPVWELGFVGILYGACIKSNICGAVIEKAKNVYEDAREVGEEYGQRWFGSQAYYNELASSGATNPITEYQPGPVEPVQEAFNPPDPQETGPETGQVSAGSALDILPDQVADAIKGVLKISATTTIIITTTTYDILNEMTPQRDLDTLSNVEIAAFVLVVLAVAAAGATLGPLGGMSAGFIGKGALAIIGVTISVSVMQSNADAIRKSIQLQE